MAREITCDYGCCEHLCPAVRGCDAAINFLADTSRRVGVARLGHCRQSTALGAAALARGFFLPPAAGDTSTSAVRTAQTIDAGIGVSPMGGRAAHARWRSCG